MMNLTNENYLDEVIGNIQSSGLIEYDHEQMERVLKSINNSTNAAEVKVKMKSKYYGIITQYLGFEKVANIDTDVVIPELYIEDKGGRVFSNLASLIRSTCKKFDLVKSTEIQKLPFEQRKTQLKREINEKLDFKFSRETSFLDNSIEYFEKKLKYSINDDTIGKDAIGTNLHPLVFLGETNYGFLLFDFLMTKVVLRDKTKVSTIYRYFSNMSYFKATSTQDQFLKFIKKVYSIRLPKIFQKSYKMEDFLEFKLPDLEKEFRISRNLESF